MLHSTILAAPAADGGFAHLVPFPPEALPAIAPAALLAAWEAARQAAAFGQWGAPWRLPFQTESGPLRLAIADRDACRWSTALDRTADPGTLRGLRRIVCPRRRLAEPALRPISRPSSHVTKAHPMPRPARLVPLLLLLAGACSAPNFSPRPAPVALPGGQDNAALEACRAEATRVVQFRDRGELMRTDETEASRGTFSSAPFGRVETERMGQQMSRDRLIEECLRGANRATPAAAGGASPGSVATPPAAGRALPPPGLR